MRSCSRSSLRRCGASCARSPALARRQPPPAVIPTEETQKARDLYKVGRYTDAVAAAKAALNKNERYTPAMLVMAKSYYKLHKYEWMKKLWEMMQANGASSAEKAEIYQLLAFLEVDAEERPGRHQAVQAGRRGQARRRRSSGTTSAPSTWRPRTTPTPTPVLERAAQLQPGFAKAHLNLGDAYRGAQAVRKSAGGVPEGPTAIPELCRRGVQPRHPVPRRRQDAEHGSFRQGEHRDPVLPEVQADDGRDPAAVRPGGGLHRRGAGQDQERGEAAGPPEEAGGARGRAGRQEGRRRRQEGRRAAGQPAPGAPPPAPGARARAAAPAAGARRRRRPRPSSSEEPE